MRKIIALVFIVLVTQLSCKESPLFEKIDAETSGITFSNRIIENDSINILDFEYVYNGSGVGIADFDKDGLQDVFFSGNQVANQLYLNKGNFKFENISATAGIEAKDRWCSGVTVVDINADGWMDIYVSATVHEPAEFRENLLFVNQGLKDGKPFFKEMAKEYGVNDNSHAENAAFFDYDNDGDLDLYVLVNVIDQYPNTYRPKVKDGTYPNTDKLYRCEWDIALGHPVYKEVSKEAGISIEGYGLGINICDINQDGWKDIYITNDYAADDLLYVNNQDGTFTDKASQYFKHTSNSAMGNDVADINNDGFLDIFAVDMLAKNNLRKKVLAPPNNYQLFKLSDEFGYNYQYMRNTLQLNNGIKKGFNEPMFSEISMMAGIAETDWSWTPSLADFDNDGYKDLIVTNGFPKDVTDRDFMAFRAEASNLAEKFYMLSQIPEVKISNYAFKNDGNLQFENVTEKWGMDIPSFSNGAVYADLDNDGDLDYVVNNINDSAFVFRNNLIHEKVVNNAHFLRVKCVGDNLNINGIGAVLTLEFEDGEKIIHENNPYRGYLSSVEPLVHFGIGNKKIKNLRIQWYNGLEELISNVKPDTELLVSIKNAKLNLGQTNNNQARLFEEISDQIKLDYVHQEIDFIDYNIQNLMPFKMSELGPGMSVGDVNGDGLEDVFMGGPRAYSGVWFLQKANGSFDIQFLMGAQQQPQKRGEDLGSLLFDADEDGDLDLYICRGGNEDYKDQESFRDVFYINDGKGNFTESTLALPRITESTSCVRAADFDNDGDLDLIVAGRNVPTEYPKFTNSRLLRNDSKNGNIKFTDITKEKAKELLQIGLICDVLWTDFDNDGWVDVILAGEWSEIKFLKNNKGSLEVLKNTGLESYKGLWTSINGADFDHDGDIDYVLGNVGLNTLFKVSKEEPFKLIAKDFDNNGNFDVIPFAYFNTEDKKRKLVPFNGKDDVNKQLNVSRQRFVSYKEFANATPENLLTADERAGALELDLTYGQSVYVENLGNGKFALKALPILAQISTIQGIIIEDFDQDGFQDILISGNNYGNEISVGRYDASNGLFLKGLGNGNFVPNQNSGFYLPFNAKSSVSLFNSEGEQIIFSSQNRGKLNVFKTNLKELDSVIPKKAKGINLELNGKQSKKEIYYGSSYMGQSTRRIVSPATNVKISFY